MPLHPVGIIIGTTLAVIGSTYAFKKFIYDPHLAPLVEALLAAHQSPATPHRDREPVPVPSRSIGSSTSRQHHYTHLRRRSRPSRSSFDQDHELREQLLSRHPNDQSWGRTSSFDLKESVFGDEQRHSPSSSPARRRGPTRKNSDKLESPIAARPLIELADEQPISAEDQEVREILFNYAATPLEPSRMTSPVPAVAPYLDLPATPATLAGASRSPKSQAVTSPALSALPFPSPNPIAMSFLSLSHPSSPVRSLNDLQTPSMSGLADGWASITRPLAQVSGSDEEDDLTSLPETSTSGYEDAEAYSPVSRARSPASAHVTSPRPAIGLMSSFEGDLPFIPDVREDVERHLRRHSSPRRGPMSVISVEESDDGEGWRSESEWEALSR